MPGVVLSGNKLAKQIKEQLRLEVEKVRSENPSFKPGLSIVQVGDRADSNVYVGHKLKVGSELGFKTEHVKLDSSVTQDEIISTIDRLNNDDSVHGIIVQLPLECNNAVDSDACTNRVDPGKDVDGLHPENAGRLARGELHNCFVPCTPRGCMELIKLAGAEVKGAVACVIGRSKIVGSPMADVLKWNHATVTTCHTRTRDMPGHVRQADIVVVGAGAAKMVKSDWIKPGAVVIDCGINSVDDPKAKKGYRLVGDVDYEQCAEKASHITPVPGGVGPMTVVMLMQNTFDSARRRSNLAGVGGNVSQTRKLSTISYSNSNTRPEYCIPPAVSSIARNSSIAHMRTAMCSIYRASRLFGR